MKSPVLEAKGKRQVFRCIAAMGGVDTTLEELVIVATIAAGGCGESTLGDR